MTIYLQSWWGLAEIGQLPIDPSIIDSGHQLYTKKLRTLIVHDIPSHFIEQPDVLSPSNINEDASCLLACQISPGKADIDSKYGELLDVDNEVSCGRGVGWLHSVNFHHEEDLIDGECA